MTKKIFLLLFFFFIPGICNGQSRVFDCLNREELPLKEAKAIISLVQDEYSKTKGVEGTFSQDSFNAALEMSEVAVGRFYFSKPSKMKWLYEAPKKQTFLLNEGTIWLYQEEENQVLIDSFDKIFVSDLPVSFLMGLGDLKKDFEVQSGCRTPDGNVIELKPSAEVSSQLAAFKLLVREASYFPAGASIKDAGGNTTSLLFSDVNVKQSFEDNLFELKFPEGVDIQDRRKKNGR
ncbi:MAG: outer membrane lipoprotein carrier protein LolA [SAR324 cluster bacterium]|uniref:Outer membrane lipoprotein carrier protein LolA n=1 Tax=SAR324 cluster bacterium TaxID=2024889 RepID=A0A7X9FPV2_9DELT|nr:outer membrane lipoprotein carrier protein LolA [SAR324 cluster bacterium]